MAEVKGEAIFCSAAGVAPFDGFGEGKAAFFLMTGRDLEVFFAMIFVGRWVTE
jgi:hypothetical protein